jgi:hypothetical protein
MELIKRFDMIFTEDLNDQRAFIRPKEQVQNELKGFDLEKMFFSLYIENEK